MTSRNLLPVLVASLVAGFASAANANSITFTDPGRATVTFDTSLNTLKVTLTDLVVGPTGVADNLSGLQFIASTQTGATLAPANQTGVDRTIAADGTYSDSANQQIYWNLSVGTFLFLDTLNSARPGDNNPDETIVGSPSGATYAGGGSINGNGPHNPFIANTATFFITIPGMTAADTVGHVLFRFGTTADSGYEPPGPGTPGGGGDQPVPEPTSLVLLGSGLVGAAAAVRNRRRKHQS